MNIPTSSFPTDTDQTGILLIRSLGIPPMDAFLLLKDLLDTSRGRGDRITRAKRCIRLGGEALADRETSVPFSQAVRASLEARKHRRPRTLQEIRYMAARMMKKCPELARKQVRSITPEDCERYLRKSFSTPRQRHKGRLILSGILRPGERLPVDGEVTEGSSTVDESMLTGEQLPLLKQAGDAVYAGTINTDAPLEIRVNHRIEESRLAQIMRLQDHALDDKPAIAQMADVLSRHFILVLLFIAAGVWTFWHFHQPEQAFWVTLAVLVATCPCALSLATPTALTSATARLTRAGILLRRGHVLDVLTRANRIVMDKTGTLTTGNISLTSTKALGSLDETRCLAIARALEAYSEHPIARAFRSNAAEDAVLLAANKVTPVIGHGIEGVIDGRHYRLGSARWLGISDANEAQADGLVIYLADEDRALARFLLTDTLRPDAKALIQAFKAAGLKTTILTGDSSAQADEVARELGVDELVKGVTPDGKLAYLKEHEARGDISIMVGDGINDAPVLAGAHASFAMAGGTDLAKNSADAILLADDLSRLLDARALALRTRKIIKENFAWSIGYNLLVLPLAASGWLPPYVAAAGMSLSSLIVVTNSMRLNR